MKRLLFAFIFVALLAAPQARAAEKDKEKEGDNFRFRRDPKIGAVTNKKPVHIKLKRLKSGDYTWELSGDDIKEIERLDRELRKKFGKKRKKKD